MSTELPVIETKEVDEDKSSTITDIVEAGEEVYKAIREVRGKGGSTDTTVQTTQLNTGNNGQDNKSSGAANNVATLTGGAILLVAGAMLTKRFLF